MIRAKGGAQTIDRVWSFLCTHIGKHSDKMGTASMRVRPRSVQWCDGHKGEDLWLDTGTMLKPLQCAGAMCRRCAATNAQGSTSYRAAVLTYVYPRAMPGYRAG